MSPHSPDPYGSRVAQRERRITIGLGLLGLSLIVVGLRAIMTTTVPMDGIVIALIPALAGVGFLIAGYTVRIPSLDDEFARRAHHLPRIQARAGFNPVAARVLRPSLPASTRFYTDGRAKLAPCRTTALPPGRMHSSSGRLR